MNNILYKFIKEIPFLRNKIRTIRGLKINEMIIDHINSGKPIIIDVGANTGQTIDNYLQLIPNSIIYSFEPTSDLFSELEIKYKNKSNVTLSNLALSDSNGEVEFFESEFSPTNSILKPNIELYQKIEKNDPSSLNLSKTFTKTLKVAKVESLRFDDWYKAKLKGEIISVFKTDTQGFDFEVLNGAKETLPNIKFIIVETQFQEFYKGSKPFYKMFEYLYNNGFHLYNLSKNNTKAQILECDAIFINSKFSN